jgi:hypothetical protein
VHNEDLHNLCSPSITRMIKSMSVKWAGLVHSRIYGREMHTTFWWVNLKVIVN